MPKDKPKIVILMGGTDLGGTAISTSLLVKHIDREKFRVEPYYRWHRKAAKRRCCWDDVNE